LFNWLLVLTEKILDGVLENLEKSINSLTKDVFENLEMEGGFEETNNFLQNQFDIRLENLLGLKKSSIHHLETGMKNKVIQKRQCIFEEIRKQYKN
jgi:hypothetical protein